MFKEIVREYALENLVDAFIPVLAFQFCLSKEQINNVTPEWIKEAQSHLHNKEYDKIIFKEKCACGDYTVMAAILYLQERYNDLISLSKNQVMDKSVEEFLLSAIEYEKEESASAFAKLVELSSYKSKLPNIIKDPLCDFILYTYGYKSSAFFNEEYRIRKMFIPIEKIGDISGGKVPEIMIEDLPDLTLPIGHPIPYEVYVGHPLDKSVYYPVSSYQVELLKDKIHEFCYLVQCLGATELTIETYNASFSSKENNSRTDASAELGSFAKGNYHNDSKSKLYEEISNSMSVHQQFTPNKEAFIPEGLLWFKHEISWQRMASQRMIGGLTFHEERMETKKVQMLENRELTQVKAQIKALFVKADFNYDSEEESKFEQHENEILSIKVKF